jgi:hypothetical protein
VSNRISLRKRLLTANTQPFTNDFPRADIHELIAPDLLHQVIKGGFKDHLVSWVEDYLVLVHGKTGAKKYMADIDRRCVAYSTHFSLLCNSLFHSIALVPLYPNLRRFKQGRGFKQWTGDDSKALMKVSLVSHSPQLISHCFVLIGVPLCY